MDSLQSFIKCIYRGSIRTESVESIGEELGMELSVRNIDEHGGEISRGKFSLIDGNLIYSMEGFEPIIWPIDLIRRFGGSNKKFIFEAGRRCRTGEGIYIFETISNDESFDAIRTRMGRFRGKIDKSTSTENPQHHQEPQQQQQHQQKQTSGPLRSIPYTLIDFDTTKALTESVQAHAASRASK